ncbi:MAG: hypothetical protein AAF219_06670 [Myxococcota bacterium]
MSRIPSEVETWTVLNYDQVSWFRGTAPLEGGRMRRIKLWAVTALCMCACTPDDSEELAIEICDNETDDDNDGAVDCEDQRCSGAPICLQATACGDGIRNGLEFCDGDDLGGVSCGSQGFLEDVGEVRCRRDCAGYDTDLCLREDLCGNGVRNGAEQCDSTDLGGLDCLSRGFEEGDLACDNRCQLDESACMGVNPCGNGRLDSGEVCDGGALAGESCESLGSSGEGLGCLSDCSGFDISLCDDAFCGNDRIDPDELCDGAALPDARSCVTEGFATGSLRCSSDCDALLTDGCTLCGNGRIDPGELCDGTDFSGASCQTQGFTDGTLACSATCDSLDTQGCSRCGNGTLDSEEVCDGGVFRDEASCRSEGFQTGTIACASNCRSLDTSSCTGFSECGNGVLDGVRTVRADGSDVRYYQEFCEPGIPVHIDPISLAENPLATGCLLYDTTAPIDDTSPVLCNDDCTLDFSACDGVPTGDFCALLGWIGDGICDPCDRISDGPDSDCAHSVLAATNCGDGIADGELDSEIRFGFFPLPGSPFDFCDGEDLRGLTCGDLGFQSGELACRSDCNWNTDGCEHDP